MDYVKSGTCSERTKKEKNLGKKRITEKKELQKEKN
jgi:hypothetical protein